jgi:hypothetical protein
LGPKGPGRRVSNFVQRRMKSLSPKSDTRQRHRLFRQWNTDKQDEIIVFYQRFPQPNHV